MPPLTDSQKDAIDRAISLRRDALNFLKTWPTLNSQDEQVPSFTWKELERQLASLAATAQNAVMAADLVSATRKQASFKPPEMVLREILCVAGALMDESFPSPILPGPGRSELGGGPNDLTVGQRLAFIAAVMLATAFAFGSLLAGLHALQGLL